MSTVRLLMIFALVTPITSESKGESESMTPMASASWRSLPM